MRAPARYSTDCGFLSRARRRTTSAMRVACSRMMRSCSRCSALSPVLHQQQLGVAEQGGERVVDLVLERDGRLADAGEPARPRELRLRGAARRVLARCAAPAISSRARRFSGELGLVT